MPDDDVNTEKDTMTETPFANVPTCRSCRAPLLEGAHLHPEQCIKALRRLLASYENTVMGLAASIGRLRLDRDHQGRLLWEAVHALGGEVAFPDVSKVVDPPGHTRRLATRRNEANDAFILSATTAADAAEDAAAETPTQAPAS